MYIVVGANGFLGTYIMKNILELTNEHIVATARDIQNVKKHKRIKWVRCDVTNFEDIDYLNDITKKSSENKVIYLAAYHHPDLVEKNPRLAWNVNITALSYFINKMENIKCLFYPSTDSVYGESFDRYHFREEDLLKPVNVYGKQKIVAENVIKGYGYNVVRYPFLIAPSLSPVKKHFYDNIVENITSNIKVEMFADSVRSSLDFNTAAKLLIQLIEIYDEQLPKVINISGDEELSKYDVGVLIAHKVNVATELIVPISIHDISGIFETKRATSTLMDNSLLKKVLGISKISIEI